MIVLLCRRNNIGDRVDGGEVERDRFILLLLLFYFIFYNFFYFIIFFIFIFFVLFFSPPLKEVGVAAEGGCGGVEWVWRRRVDVAALSGCGGGGWTW